MYLPIQISRTGLKTSYNKGLEKAAKGAEGGSRDVRIITGNFLVSTRKCDLEPEGVGLGDLELRIELAKMEYGRLFADFSVVRR